MLNIHVRLVFIAVNDFFYSGEIENTFVQWFSQHPEFYKNLGAKINLKHVKTSS